MGEEAGGGADWGEIGAKGREERPQAAASWLSAALASLQTCRWTESDSPQKIERLLRQAPRA